MYGIGYDEAELNEAENELRSEQDAKTALNELYETIIVYNRMLDLLSQVANSQTTETPFDESIDRHLVDTSTAVYAGLKYVQTQYELLKD